jgi:hypothetical protein
MVNQKADNRSIVWIFDPVGNTGKSILVKYLCLLPQPPSSTFGRGRGRNGLFIGWANNESIMFHRANFQDKDPIIFSLARSKSDFLTLNQMYSAMEEIKDGAFFSAKYRSDAVFTSSPHVLGPKAHASYF